MQDFVFLYTKPTQQENTPYIYKEDFEELGPSTYSLSAPHHSLTPSKVSHLSKTVINIHVIYKTKSGYLQCAHTNQHKPLPYKIPIASTSFG